MVAPHKFGMLVLDGIQTNIEEWSETIAGMCFMSYKCGACGYGLGGFDESTLRFHHAHCNPPELAIRHQRDALFEALKGLVRAHKAQAPSIARRVEESGPGAPGVTGAYADAVRVITAIEMATP